MRVLESLNAALSRALDADKRVLLLGEDLLDPYGGAFKVTRGLSTRYPDRVLTTPISEAAITGVANGLAMRGFRPVVEIMFGDFLTLAFDQIVNHAAKFTAMYNGKVRVPVTIRTPMGGRRGYGPTHSQSLEKHLLGVPGLRVVAPSTFHDAGMLLFRAIIDEDAPVVFIEHKLLYPCAMRLPHQEGETGGSFPAAIVRADEKEPAQITFVTYGYTAELVFEAMERLVMDHEIFSEMVVMSQLNPCDVAEALESAKRSGCVITVEEGTLTGSWGAEVVSQLVERIPGIRTCRVATKDAVIPACLALEEQLLPSVDDICAAAVRCVATVRRM